MKYARFFVGVVALTLFALFSTSTFAASSLNENTLTTHLQFSEPPATATPFPHLTNIEAIAVGGDSGAERVPAHSCALTDAGQVYCWGDNYFHQIGNWNHTDSVHIPVLVTGIARPVVHLDTGATHSCAVTDVGTVYCWGQNESGQLGNGTLEPRSRAVRVLGITNAIQVATGGLHSCALLTDESVWCWGANASGQLGNGTTTDSLVPVQVMGLTGSIRTLSAGGSTTCAVLTYDTLQCWGRRIGDGTDDIHTAATMVTSNIASVEVGLTTRCFVTTAGAAECWGNNNQGQLGDGTTIDNLSPVPVVGLSSGVTQISANIVHTCAVLQSGGVKCWGYNGEGRLGDGTYTNSITPVEVLGLAEDVIQVGVGSGQSCALLSTHEVQCWGTNFSGQLGDGTPLIVYDPMSHLASGSDIVSITQRPWGGCGLTSAGGVKCWGDNRYGQVGDGTTVYRNTPVDVIGLAYGVQKLAVSDFHVCALLETGTIKCWGRGGQLGVGDTTDRFQPTDVDTDAPVVDIAVGTGHTCVLLDIQRVQCWGANNDGQLGTHDYASRLFPSFVPALNDVLALGVAGKHTCVIVDLEGVQCWGDNEYGYLGDGTTTDRNIKAPVVGLDGGVLRIVVGEYGSCAFMADSSIQCWGRNSFNALGVGDVPALTPQPFIVLDPDEVADITPPYDATCALLKNDGVKCWGSNEWGRLGAGLAIRQSEIAVTPIGLNANIRHLMGGYNPCVEVGSGNFLCWGENRYQGVGLPLARVNDSPVPSFVVSTPVELNYDEGKPDSVFRFTVRGFTPDTHVVFMANDAILGSATTSGTGTAAVFITSQNAPADDYRILAVSTAGDHTSLTVTVDTSAPLRAPEGGGTTFDIGRGLSETRHIFLPLMQ